MAAPYLPAREQPVIGESLTGYFRRHVAAMGYDGFGRLLSLVENIRFPPHLDHLERGAALDALGGLLRRDVETLVGLTAHARCHRLMLRRRQDPSPTQCDSKTLLRYFDAAHSRVCRQCLTESPLVERLNWSFRPLPICIEHSEVLLDRCPSCRRRFSPRRLDLVRCRCGYVITAAPAHFMHGDLLDLARTINSWLSGAELTSLELPAHAGFWWLERLHAAVIRTPTWIKSVRVGWSLPPELDDESTAWLAAAALIENGSESFAKFLDVYQTIHKHHSTATGVGRSFGMLLRDADRLERFGFPGPAEMLRTYLLERYTQGHLTGKVILFQSARHRSQLALRPWLSQTAAAKSLGVRPPTIADLVRRGILNGMIHPAGRRGRTVGVVSRASLETFRRRMTTSLSTRAAGEQLGIERHRVAELIETGILRDAVRTARGWRLSQATVDELLDCLRRLNSLPADRRNWIPLREATRRFGASGLNLVRIVSEVLNGRLAARRGFERPTLRHIFLELKEVHRRSQTLQAETHATIGFSLNRLAAVLVPGQPLKDVVLRKWIRAGLLTATRRRKAWQITPEEVDRFRAKYCLAREACSLLVVTRSTLARWEVERRIAPVYGRRTHPGAGASVFLRADVERLATLRAA